MFMNKAFNKIFIGLLISSNIAYAMASRTTRLVAPAARTMAVSSAYRAYPSIGPASLASMEAARRYSSGAFAGSGPSYFRATQPQFMTRLEAFKMLGVPEKSSSLEIKKAYRQKAKEFHPDTGGSDYLMKKLNEANEIATGKTLGSDDSDDSDLLRNVYKWAKEAEADKAQREREQKDAERREKERQEKQDMIFKAIRSRDLSAVRHYIDSKSDMLNTVIDDKDGRPLSFAVNQALDYNRSKNPSKDSPELLIIQSLLDAGANPNQSNCFVYAVGNIFRHGTLNTGFDLIKILLDAGANPNQCSEFGMTPLLEAVYRHSPEVVKMLLDAGAKVNMVYVNEGSLDKNQPFADTQISNATPLSVAIGAGEDRLKCVELLLAARANPNAMVKYENQECSILRIWLIWSLMYPDDTSLLFQLQALIEAGADLNIINSDGKTVYDYALEEKNEKLINILRVAGARSAKEKKSMWDRVIAVWWK